MTSISAKLFAGSLFCFTAIACAGDALSYSSEFWPSEKQHLRTSMRHIEGGGIGYNKGYTTFEGFFAPAPQQWALMPFLDVRGHVFNNGKMAANVGVGLRKILGNRVYGLNTFYDYRNAKKINYNQVGFGLETLGKRFDFRINGYLPVGKQCRSVCGTRFNGFVGHRMKLLQKYQFAMKGFNAELGCHFGQSRLFNFYAAAGPYYYAGKIGANMWGGKVRLTGRFKDYVTIELSNSYDKIFRNRFQGQLTLTLPFGGGSHVEQADKSCDMSNVLNSRMVQPVVRQEIIVESCRKKNSVAIDSATCQPFNFVFVNNTSHSHGTYESPYPTLALAQANSKVGDIIYVFPGNGTTQGMDAGITLQHNQKFWGSGINHALQTTQGSIIIPAQSTQAPKMTNTAGNGITVASVNQISGFTLTEVFDNGIFGVNVENIEISDCTIDRSLSDQIHLEYSGASGIAVLDRLTITNGALKGIFIDSATSSMACAVNNCTIQDNGSDSLNASFAHQATCRLMNNTFERNGNNNVINFSGQSTLLVSGNTFSNNTSINIAPLTIIAGAAPVSATITKNTMSGNTCGAIHCVLNNTDLAQLTINNNTMTNNGIGSIGQFGAPIFVEPNSTTAGNCILRLTDNTFSDNSGAGLYCSNGSYNNFQVNATGNTLTGNGGAGFVFANGSNTFTLDANNNIIANGGDHGITTAGGITIATANMTISNNTITGNTNSANGIALSHEGTTLNFVVTDNDISQNDTSGIILYSGSVIENVVVKIENNTINNNLNIGSNVSGGVDLEQFTNLSGTLINNTLSDNVSSDVFIGSADSSPNVCLEMRGNSSNMGYVLSSGTGTFNLAPCDVDTVNTGAITTIGTITTVQSCPGTVPCGP